MSYLIDFIKQHPDDWEDRLNQKRITIKHQDNLVIFNYSILADFTDPYVREARGIIINLDNLQVVCRGFDKFGNFGESYVDTIDWSTARVQQKVDGSIMKVWFYDGKWRVSTNAVIDAAAADCNGSGLSFKDIFDQAAANVKLDYSRLNKDNTYIFELVSRYNRVVIDYNCEPTLWHIGTRNNLTGLESVEDIGVKHPAEYPLHSLEDCIAAAAKLNDSTQSVTAEGYVVVDADWHRIKVKSPAYVAIHNLIPNGEISDEKIIELILLGDTDEILTYIPSLKDRLHSWNNHINDLQFAIYLYCENRKKEVINNHLTRKDWAIVHKHDLYFPFGIDYIFKNKEPNIRALQPNKILKLWAAANTKATLY